ncbi:MAG: CBS domain-containing protein [Desulfovibrionaceae bacterium]|nr:CBS domain-containing protein [Desulfovibrionaceae bacterium]
MVSVADLMTDTVFTLQPSDTLSDVRSLMELAKIRHTPVTDDDGTFQGLISNRDLLACTISRLAEIDSAVQEEIDTAIRVSDVMRRDVVCVEPETSLKEAARLLYENKYGCLPVLKGRKLVGILTEADFLRLAISLLEGTDTI